MISASEKGSAKKWNACSAHNLHFRFFTANNNNNNNYVHVGGSQAVLFANKRKKKQIEETTLMWCWLVSPFQLSFWMKIYFPTALGLWPRRTKMENGIVERLNALKCCTFWLTQTQTEWYACSRNNDGGSGNTIRTKHAKQMRQMIIIICRLVSCFPLYNFQIGIM